MVVSAVHIDVKGGTTANTRTVVDSPVIIDSEQTFSRLPKLLYYQTNKDKTFSLRLFTSFCHPYQTKSGCASVRKYFSGPNKDFLNVIPQDKGIYRLACQFFDLLYEYSIDSVSWLGPVVVRHWSQDYNMLHRLFLHTHRYQPLEVIVTQQEKSIQRMYNNMEGLEGKTKFQDIIDHNNRTRDEVSCHLEFNTEMFTCKEWIITRAKIGGDLFQRWVERLTYLPEKWNVSEYVDADRDRSQYLLDIHDKPSARFLDVDPNDPFA
ncbi:hypothetical protein BG015_000604 [Linnemannia schmuckeri]|uniref:Uncharacterized protein n=1 Tax=Linnemannia schmuckeri TaxID=64567 RepID=A0A9P5V7F8_9FUNG|nr:hypothetical protein BG015_000604 [Linnemannia schmuckeri]